MLSFVQSAEDILFLKNLYSDSIIMSKIENKKGMNKLDEIVLFSEFVMAARGNLYNELDYPHDVVNAVKKTCHIAGEKSVLGSRILTSLLDSSIPSCSDLMDINYLYDIGYKRFMVGDDICFDKEMLDRAINIFKMMF